MVLSSYIFSSYTSMGQGSFLFRQLIYSRPSYRYALSLYSVKIDLASLEVCYSFLKTHKISCPQLLSRLNCVNMAGSQVNFSAKFKQLAYIQ